RAVRRGAVRRVSRDLGPDAELRDRLRLLHVLVGVGARQRPVGGRLQGFQSMARAGSSGLRRVPAGRRSIGAGAAEISGSPRPLAGRDGRAAVHLVRADRGGGGGPAARDNIAVATVIYSAGTFACMALFGVEEWIGRGEAFSAYFGMFSRLGPFEARHRQPGA